MQLQYVSTDLQAKQKTNLGILSKTYTSIWTVFAQGDFNVSIKTIYQLPKALR